MKKHRRKIALAVALVLLFGSAAASAANYTAGRGVMPSFAGASDALGLAASGATSAANWIVSRARSAVGSAFSYQPTAPTRPAEVANPPSELPMYTRGLPSPIDVDPHWAPHAPSALGAPDRVQAMSFEDGASATRQPSSVAVASLMQSPLPGAGGNGNALTTLTTPPGVPNTPSITSPVPELPPYALLIAGMSVLAAFSRRRRA